MSHPLYPAQVYFTASTIALPYSFNYLTSMTTVQGAQITGFWALRFDHTNSIPTRGTGLETTANLAADISEDGLKQALTATPSFLGDMTVVRVGPSAAGGFTWTVEYLKEDGSIDLPDLIYTDPSTMLTGAASISATVCVSGCVKVRQCGSEVHHSCACVSLTHARLCVFGSP